MNVQEFNKLSDYLYGYESVRDNILFYDDAFQEVLDMIKEDKYHAAGVKIAEAIRGLEIVFLLHGALPLTLKDLHKDRDNVVSQKRRDYTRNTGDVLFNFKNQSDKLGIRPELCLAVHMEKQYSAILTYIKTDGESESEPFIKRVGDCLNYLELLFALLIDTGKAKL